jgi:hypothetical protein
MQFDQLKRASSSRLVVRVWPVTTRAQRSATRARRITQTEYDKKALSAASCPLVMGRSNERKIDARKTCQLKKAARA